MTDCFYLPPRCSSAAVREIAEKAQTEYTLVCTKTTDVRWVNNGLHRMLQVASWSGAAMVYADHFSIIGGEVRPAPLAPYQRGSVRDDFDFGSVLLFRTSALKAAAQTMTATVQDTTATVQTAQPSEDYRFAGLYDLRLRVSRMGEIAHIGEFLYYEPELDTRTSGQKQFDYVAPNAREVQIEMEKACTAHLKAIGAWLPPVFKPVDLTQGEFKVEASVVIPCKNRVRTIADAIRSALDQQTNFPYNVIVVDDNSTDGTAEVIKSLAAGDPRVIYIAQDSSWHAIGGNWNAAAGHPDCGRFALQLDSADIYSGPHTVQKFVDAFYREQAAMIIGSYRITDFNLNTIPPGLIDHKEWTEGNGRNNALRINGLGAPRGFFVPVLREILFPTVKYGEDYSVALRISREWRIGRIWEELYCCRRWDDNSDADLSPEKVNANNIYKDSVRSWEISARIAMNAASKAGNCAEADSTAAGGTTAGS